LAQAACAVLTWRHVGFWRDSETLFRRALAVVPDNTTAYINLGAALERQGRLEEALTNYLAALRLEPRRAPTHNNLGNVLDGLGRHAEAIEHYHEALRLKPGTALVHRNLGTALAAQGRFDDAMAQYAEAQRLKPEDPENFHLAGVARLRHGQARAGVEELRRALRLDPNHARVLHRLARVLATDEDASLRDGAEAVRLATRAVELTAGQQPQVLDTLGMALAEAGRFDEAIVATRQAADLLEAIGQPEAAAAVRSRAALYQSRQPFRESNHGQ
jgi:superkiller protein 3